MRRTWIFTSFIYLGIVFTQYQTEACSYIEEPIFKKYVLFEPKYVKNNDPINYRFGQLTSNHRQSLGIENLMTANLSEWQDYLKNPDISKEHVKEAIYDYKLDHYFVIQTNYAQSLQLPDSLKSNSLVESLYHNNRKDVLDYLLYSKECELVVMESDPWLDYPDEVTKLRAGETYEDREQRLMDYELQFEKNKKIKRSASIEKGKILYNSTKDSFLKLRYAYQTVRLAHYNKDYSLCLSLFDELASMLQSTQSIIYYWALEHKAGSLFSSGKEAEAAFLFAKVFANCESRRFTSLLSFKVDEAVWSEAMALCKNDQEKMDLYFIRSFQKNANQFQEMQSIYQIDPSSKYLDILLLSQVQTLEDNLFHNLFEEKDVFNLLYKKYANISSYIYFQELLQFTQAFASNHKSDLWNLAAIYLQYLSGDCISAQSNLSNYINRLEVGTDPYKDAMKLQIIFDLTSAEDLTTMENQLFDRVEKTKDEQLIAFAVDILGRKCGETGQKAKAFIADKCLYSPKRVLADNIISDLHYSPDSLLLEDIINRKKTTVFEKYLSNELNNEEFINQLLEAKATMLLSQNKLQEAISMFEKVPEKYLTKYYDNPFENIQIKDWWSYKDENDYYTKRNNSSKAFTKLDIAKEILVLIQKSEKDQNANDYLKLGNAYYNISYYGTNSLTTRHYRGSSNWANASDLHYLNYYDCSLALKYYQKALELSVKKDKELAAKACFMAAKCEQNQYFISHSYDGVIERSDPNSIQKIPFRNYFKELKAKFAKTSFYQEALNECMHFKDYVKRF